jgi:sporulation protein YlmC with PRC-barrel domain
MVKQATPRALWIIPAMAALLLTSTLSAQEPAPTASGFASEGKQDLGASTSQSGDHAQINWNLFSTLEGTELYDTKGEKAAKLVDVVLDPSGQIRRLIIGTGFAALGTTKRSYDTQQLPTQNADGVLALPLAAQQIETLPEFEESPAGSWSVAAIVGSEISNTEISVKDVRFAPSHVDRVILESGNGPFANNSTHEVPFSDLQLSGNASEPTVGLTPSGLKQVKSN